MTFNNHEVGLNVHERDFKDKIFYKVTRQNPGSFKDESAR